MTYPSRSGVYLKARGYRRNPLRWPSALATQAAGSSRRLASAFDHAYQPHAAFGDRGGGLVLRGCLKNNCYGRAARHSNSTSLAYTIRALRVLSRTPLPITLSDIESPGTRPGLWFGCCR